MAGYVDPFAHRLRHEGAGQPSDDADERGDLEPIVDLTDDEAAETEGLGVSDGAPSAV